MQEKSSIAGSFGRTLNYVRISVTDRCNFRCRYCMAETGVPLLSHDKIMRYEDVAYLCGILRSVGVRRIRLTGGEPFVRRGFMPFLEGLRSRFPSLALSVTTNGSMVEPYAHALGDLGLDGINVSLDSLNPRRFTEITRLGQIAPVIRGIRALRRCVKEVKINTVIIRGFNDGELPELLSFADGEGLTLRLIEFMPLDKNIWSEDSFISTDEMLRSLPDRQYWVEEDRNPEAVLGPAVYYKNSKTCQRLGLISAVSRCFCSSCNRLRITCDGQVRSCLFSQAGPGIAEALKERDDDRVIGIINDCASRKPQSWDRVTGGGGVMSRIGG